MFRDIICQVLRMFLSPHFSTCGSRLSPQLLRLYRTSLEHQSLLMFLHVDEIIHALDSNSALKVSPGQQTNLMAWFLYLNVICRYQRSRIWPRFPTVLKFPRPSLVWRTKR